MRIAGVGAVVLVSMFAVSACSSGGGTTAASGTTSTGGQTGSSSTVSWTVEPVEGPWITTATLIKPGTPTAFPAASGTSPNFGANLPAAGTVFPLEQSAMYVDTNAHGAGGSGLNNGVQLTYSGMQTINGTATPVFEITIPDYNIDISGLPGNGTAVNAPSGQTARLVTASLNYSLYAAWTLTPFLSNASGPETGFGVSGYQTPAGSVPTSGSATYLGNTGGAPGGVEGTILASTGSTLAVGTVSGNASVNVNFSTHAVSGTLSSMTVTPTDGTATPWNDVNLSGTLSGSAVSATTSTPAAGSGTFGFSTSAKGAAKGALFGPNGEELGLTWTLSEPASTPGKSAFGFVGAAKQ